MSQLIQCDNCGCDIDKDDAVVHELEDGETYYFCSEECYETSDLREEEEGDEER